MEIHVKGVPVLLGLDWHVTSAAQASVHARKLTKANKSPAFCVVRHQSDAMVGLVTQLPPRKRSGNSRSSTGAESMAGKGAKGAKGAPSGRRVPALAWVASAARKQSIQDAILVVPLPGGAYWLASVNEGLPNPLGDVIGEEGDITDRIGELLSVKHYQVYCPAQWKQAMYPDAIVQSLEEFLGDCSPDVFLESPFPARKVLIWSAVAVIVTVAALMALRTEKLRAEAKRKLTEAATANVKKEDPGLVFMRAMQSAYKNDIKDVGAADESRAYLAAARRLPVIQGGFRLESIVCEGRSCVQTWRRLPTATNETFGNPRADFALDRKTARVVVPVSAGTASRPTIEELPATGRFLYEFGTFLQSAESLAVSANTGQPQPFQVAGGQAPAGASVYNKGTWSMDGRLLRSTELLTSLPANMVLNRLTLAVSNDGDISWKGEGIYVAK